MKLPRNQKIELCASDDSRRIAIASPYLKGNRLVATNGRHLVVLPVERSPDDKDGYIPAAVLAAARKAGKRGDEISIGLNGAYALADGSTMPRNAELDACAYPNFEQVIPKGGAENGYKLRFSINVKSLLAVAKALDTESVVIEFKDEVNAFIVRQGALGFDGKRASGNREAFGVIMPTRIT